MRKILIAAAFGFGLLATPAAAGTLPAQGGVTAPLSNGLQTVDWRPYYHCHPRRGFCHGGRRWHRPHWRSHRYWGPRHHWRGHRHHGRHRHWR
ncbi:MAG: hypothetical protein AB7O60_12085 [Variibacter sp.]